MRPSRRRVLGAMVLTAWVVVLGVHVRREYFRPASVLLAEGARMLAPGAHYYLVRLDGNVIGIASSRLDTIPEGFRFNDELTLDVPALGEVHRTTTRSSIGRPKHWNPMAHALSSTATASPRDPCPAT